MNSRRKLVIALGASALAAPLSFLARRQPTAKLARIGLLVPGSASNDASWAAALVANLRDLGYVEGATLSVESRWVDGKNDRLPELAAELVQTSRQMSGATSELAAKNLVLIRQILPSAKRVSVLVNAADTFAKTIPGTEPDCSPDLGRRTADRHGPQRRALGRRVRGNSQSTRKRRYRPTQSSLQACCRDGVAISACDIRGRQGFADAGGVLAYTQSIADRIVRPPLYVDKMLKGAKPADLPVQQPAKFRVSHQSKDGPADWPQDSAQRTRARR
jgi:putative ABC transport system substrate-binding protein